MNLSRLAESIHLFEGRRALYGRGRPLSSNVWIRGIPRAAAAHGFLGGFLGGSMEARSKPLPTVSSAARFKKAQQCIFDTITQVLHQHLVWIM